MLVCSVGMSTSLLVKKMKEDAEARKIEAVAEADLKNISEEIDVILLGPQVAYMLAKVRERMKDQGIAVDVINSGDYGMMRGEKVLDYAISLIQGNDSI